MKHEPVRRILYHHRTQGQGAEGVHIRGIVDGFKDCGYTVDIVGPPGVDPFKTTIATHSVTPSNASFFDQLWRILAENLPQAAFETMELGYNFYAYKEVCKLLAAHRYAFLYERYALNTFALAYLARRLRLPLVLEVNDATIIERSRPLLLKKMAKSIEKKVFNRASLLITVSKYFRNLIIKNYDIDNDKILVLPNAIDPKRFKLNSKKKINKKDLNINAKYVIGCVGAFVAWHGLDFLIHAIYDLFQKIDVHVLLVGDGPAREKIEKLISDFNIAHKVTITGFVENNIVPNYIRLFDVGLMPDSNNHGSPMKILEYMVSGIPTVAADYPPIRELIDDGMDGLLFKPRDKVSFRVKIKELLNNEKMREEMGKAAKVKVMNNYTWQKNVEKLLTKIDGEIKSK